VVKRLWANPRLSFGGKQCDFMVSYRLSENNNFSLSFPASNWFGFKFLDAKSFRFAALTMSGQRPYHRNFSNELGLRDEGCYRR
jgi:hypothetical protein